MIESHVFGTKRSYRMQERNGQIEWVSNDQHLIRFNNLLQMWQVVNATTSNQIGEGKNGIKNHYASTYRFWWRQKFSRQKCCSLKLKPRVPRTGRSASDVRHLRSSQGPLNETRRDF